jgi:hypothetical protein
MPKPPRSSRRVRREGAAAVIAIDGSRCEQNRGSEPASTAANSRGPFGQCRCASGGICADGREDARIWDCVHEWSLWNRKDLEFGKLSNFAAVSAKRGSRSRYAAFVPALPVLTVLTQSPCFLLVLYSTRTASRRIRNRPVSRWRNLGLDGGCSHCSRAQRHVDSSVVFFALDLGWAPASSRRRSPCSLASMPLRSIQCGLGLRVHDALGARAAPRRVVVPVPAIVEPRPCDGGTDCRPGVRVRIEWPGYTSPQLCESVFGRARYFRHSARKPPSADAARERAYTYAVVSA